MICFKVTFYRQREVVGVQHFQRIQQEIYGNEILVILRQHKVQYHIGSEVNLKNAAL